MTSCIDIISPNVIKITSPASPYSKTSIYIRVEKIAVLTQVQLDNPTNLWCFSIGYGEHDSYLIFYTSKEEADEDFKTLLKLIS